MFKMLGTTPQTLSLQFLVGLIEDTLTRRRWENRGQ